MPSPPSEAEAMPPISISECPGSASSAPAKFATSTALYRRVGTKNTGSVIWNCIQMDGPAGTAGKVEPPPSEAGRHAEVEFLHLVGGFLDDRMGVVDTQRSEWRRPDQADADGSAPFHAVSLHVDAGNVDIASVERCSVREDRPP